MPFHTICCINVILNVAKTNTIYLINPCRFGINVILNVAKTKDDKVKWLDEFGINVILNVAKTMVERYSLW